MKLEMISTGEEVLSGQIVDTNAAWFSDAMMNLGIELQRRSTVGDRLPDLVNLFLERSRVADLILVNGGLGPTSDDLSVEAAARAAGVGLVEHAAWREHLETWFKRRGREMPASNLKQCLLPECAVLVDNPLGSAPGFRLRLNNAWLFFTPGVPAEFRAMIENQFIPFMQETFHPGAQTALHKFLTLGHGESALADQLGKVELPAGITLGFRPSLPHVEIKVFARGSEALALMSDTCARIRSCLGRAVVSERCPNLAEEVHLLLREHGRSLALAESCTGGMLASQLVEHPGSSDYLLHGVTSYSNAAKEAILGVPASVLASHGAVSIETAETMATGARRLLDSDFALAITGVAGPEGGSEDKPVGTVVLALADREQVWTQHLQFGARSRTVIRSTSCAVALDMLRRRLLDEEVIVTYPFFPCRGQAIRRHQE